MIAGGWPEGPLSRLCSVVCAGVSDAVGCMPCGQTGRSVPRGGPLPCWYSSRAPRRTSGPLSCGSCAHRPSGRTQSRKACASAPGVNFRGNSSKEQRRVATAIERICSMASLSIRLWSKARVPTPSRGIHRALCPSRASGVERSIFQRYVAMVTMRSTWACWARSSHLRRAGRGVRSLRPVGFVLHQPGVLHSGKKARAASLRQPGRGPRPGISDCRGASCRDTPRPRCGGLQVALSALISPHSPPICGCWRESCGC